MSDKDQPGGEPIPEFLRALALPRSEVQPGTTPQSDELPLAMTLTDVKIDGVPLSPENDSSGFDAVLDAVREGDFKTARELLGLDTDTPDDDEIVEAMMAYAEAQRLFASGRLPDAAVLYRKMARLFDQSSVKRIWAPVVVNSQLAEGMSLLMRGDAAGALPILDEVATRIEKEAFHSTELEWLAQTIRIAAITALAKSAANGGDLEEFEARAGQIREILERMVAKRNPEDPESWAQFAMRWAQPLEIAAMLIGVEIGELDFAGALDHLRSEDESASRLAEHMKHPPAGLDVSPFQVTLSVYQVTSALTHVANDLLVSRDALDRGRLQVLEMAALQIADLEREVLARGEAGRPYLYVLGRLRRLRTNLLTLGTPGKQDFGRFAGLISGVAFVIFVVTIFLFATPDILTTPIYLIAALAMSLVVGFGFGALRFIPLLRLVAKQKEGNPKT